MRAAACLCLLAPLSLSFVPTAQAGDWPQWLGPNRDGTSSERIAPWKGEPKVLWRKPVGEGHSSPVVADGVVYLHVKVANKNEEALLAFDAKTGDSKWAKTYARAGTKFFFGNGPRATPTVAGKHIFTFGITGLLTCFDAGGKQVWQVDTLKEFKAPNLLFGMSASPLVTADRVIVQVGNDPKKSQGTGVVAFNVADGSVTWKALDDPASYAAPARIGDNLIVLSGANVSALNPAKGTVNWQIPFKDPFSESSTTPVSAGDLLVISSVGAGTVALKPKGGQQKPEEVWKDKDLTCYFSTPLVVDKDHLFLVSGKMPPFARATLNCVETATGKVVWRKDRVGTYHASLMRLGDGKVLMLGDDGNLSLLAPDVKEFKELARSKVCQGNGDVWAHPALSNGRLYIRDAKELICLMMPAPTD